MTKSEILRAAAEHLDAAAELFIDADEGELAQEVYELAAEATTRAAASGAATETAAA